MERVATLSDRAREPELPTSIVTMAHLEVTEFHNQRNRELGVRP
jgi:hypothetical protein